MDTNPNPLLQKMKEMYVELPGDVQQAIISSDYQNKIVGIGQKYKLTVEQMGTLEMQTTLVMIGLTSPNNYQNELQAELGIADTETVGKIVDDVNEQVFSAVRESLKLINSRPEGEPEDDDNETFWRHDVPETAVTPQEETTLKQSGIVIEKTRPNSEENLKATTLPTSTLQSRANILDGIEHPTESKSSFVGKQLAGTFSMPTKETTYVPKPSLPIAPPTPKSTAQQTSPAPTAPASESPKTDPYREAF